MKELQRYHFVWLEKHPNRTETWLRERLSDGFHVHHLDGDHSNDVPSNLVLLDGRDHLELHGMDIRGLAKRGRRGRRGPQKWTSLRREIREIAKREERENAKNRLIVAVAEAVTSGLRLA